ncbi:MAG: hypothetical protein ACE5H2_08005 [Terriglobia bacterium]
MRGARQRSGRQGRLLVRRVKQLALRLDNEELPKAEVQTALDAILGQLAKARERTPVIR